MHDKNWNNDCYINFFNDISQVSTCGLSFHDCEFKADSSITDISINTQGSHIHHETSNYFLLNKLHNYKNSVFHMFFFLFSSNSLPMGKIFVLKYYQTHFLKKRVSDFLLGRY